MVMWKAMRKTMLILKTVLPISSSYLFPTLSYLPITSHQSVQMLYNNNNTYIPNYNGNPLIPTNLAIRKVIWSMWAILAPGSCLWARIYPEIEGMKHRVFNGTKLASPSGHFFSYHKYFIFQPLRG